MNTSLKGFELGYELASQTEWNQLKSLIKKCRGLLNAEGVSIMILDKDEKGEYLHFPFASDKDASVEGRLLTLRIPSDEGIRGEALRTGRVLKVDDTSTEPKWDKKVDEETGFKTRNMIAAPLVSRKGNPLGVLEVVNRVDGNAFDDENLELCASVARGISLSVENTRIFDGQRSIWPIAFPEMVSNSPAMAAVFDLAVRAAKYDFNVYIYGETGTGKTLLGKVIHRISRRGRHGKFVVSECGAIPEQLVESELFGTVPGAFNNAMNRDGDFLIANGGTILLDDIHNLPPEAQKKLLRAVQGMIRRVGESIERNVDVRVISASNQDLQDLVRKGQFSAELFFRLSVIRINLPPLRERREDITHLANRFLEDAKEKAERPSIRGFDPTAIKLLLGYSWPGNVRELESAIQAAVVMCDGEYITPRDFQLSPSPDVVLPPGFAHAAGSLRDATHELRRRMISDALERHKGNIDAVANELGIGKSTAARLKAECGI